MALLKKLSRKYLRSPNIAHSQSELAGSDECLGAAVVLALVLPVRVRAVDGLHVVLQDAQALEDEAALVAGLGADPVGGRLGWLGRGG